MQQERQAILAAVITLVLLCTILIILFLVFQKRKNALITKQKESEKRFEQEIAKTQIEIREETFRAISWELHDNIGQLMTLAKIQLQNSEGIGIEDTLITLNKGLKELRALSKSISPETLKNISLVSAIKQEIERLNKLGYIKAGFNIIGEEIPLNSDVEIVFFRIIQEFLSNTLKHAKATKLNIVITFAENTITILAKDNGRGFTENKENYSGMGIKNIIKRAQLVNARATLNSIENEGTELKIFYKLKDLQNETL
ncbi:histidine kinase [Flaviramulus sp. BrNp1-15]|uniref:sensor histidine kinase n=1 Tax=Flaviramulus sp. BrNp1-15 TaxID=2916754 RepID=UPI001EE86512|nr:ATP-binding protein [Flaviramulus sp. BrNp1-15]ULC59439.1 histidine kinase [Flaviramulus sp. BrNp1-15]